MEWGVAGKWQEERCNDVTMEFKKFKTWIFKGTAYACFNVLGATLVWSEEMIYSLGGIKINNLRGMLGIRRVWVIKNTHGSVLRNKEGVNEHTWKYSLVVWAY